MTGPRIVIRLDENGRIYQPGDTLAGEYRMMAIDRDDIKALEVSVLWFTEGKGDEDLAVHDFRRLSAEDGDWIDPRRPGRFSTTSTSPLPPSGTDTATDWAEVMVSPLGEVTRTDRS